MDYIYSFRLIFAEIFSMAAILTFLFSILPCDKSRKKGSIFIAYAMVVVYLTIMIGFQKDLFSDGMPYRPILIVTELIILPAYLVNDKKWYRYIGLASLDMIISCVGSLLYAPFHYLIMGSNVFYSAGEIYRAPDGFLGLLVYQVVNFLTYFGAGKLWKVIPLKETKEKKVLLIAQFVLFLEFFCISFPFLLKGDAMLLYTSISSLVPTGLGLIFIVRGLIWERMVFKKEQKLIQMREQIYYDWYQQISQKQKRAREVRHDLADHMQTVQLLLEKGEITKAQTYIETCNVKEERLSSGCSSQRPFSEMSCSPEV